MWGPNLFLGKEIKVDKGKSKQARAHIFCHDTQKCVYHAQV